MRIAIIRKKMQKTVLKQGIQINNEETDDLRRRGGQNNPLIASLNYAIF